MSTFKSGVLRLLVCLVLSIDAVPGSSQEPSAAAPSVAESSTGGGTAADQNVAVDYLKVLLRPLTKKELQTEADLWLELVRAKIHEVGDTEISIKELAENESRKELKQQLVTLRTEESALIERAKVVLNALKAKGGDIEASELFLAAVSNISETTDADSYWVAIKAEIISWARRDDGGRLWIRRVAMALTILAAFWAISSFCGRAMAKALASHPKASQLLENFARQTTGGVVFFVGILMALATLGIPIGPLMAALGGGGFIVGFALQETLGNFASGLLIMVYRPFDVNDYVNIAGVEGTVREMSLVSTTLSSADNKLVVIPNQSAWGETITNFTGNDTRRVDLVFGIGYEDNIQQAIDVLQQIANAHNLVLDDPATSVQVDELGDSAVNLFCRPWVKTADYWTVHSDLTRQVKERFDSEGISFPYPQRDVHLSPASPSV